MSPKEYVKNVLVTEARDFAPLQERFSQVRNIRLLHGAIGLASELSEIREMAESDDIDTVNLKEEMGDLCWYMGIMVDEMQVNPEVVFMGKQYTEREGYPNKKERLNESIDIMTKCIGTAIDFLKKAVMYGKPLNINEIEGQLQELSLEIEMSLNLYGMTSSQARERNIEKLRARYGEKFTEAAALERNLTAEREILEKK